MVSNYRHFFSITHSLLIFLLVEGKTALYKNTAF